MRFTPKYVDVDVAVESMLDPRRIVRWIYVGRLAVVSAILVAALFAWQRAVAQDTLLATLAFASGTMFTLVSAMYSEIYRRPPGRLFLCAQSLCDLCLVTAVVHLTGGGTSQFAALYILVIATAALLHPFGAGLAVAALGSVLYALDVVWVRPAFGGTGTGVWVQLLVFAIVALGSGYISARLRQAGVGKEALAARLAKVQLEAADILRTIRSGIMTIDAEGRLLYANPAAGELLGLDFRGRLGHPVLPLLARIAPALARVLEQGVRDRVRTERGEGEITREGRTVQIGVTTTFADDGDAPARQTATAIFQDISDSKRLQSMHVRAERLQAVAELSAALAHEIRNPLASIRSSVEQLGKRPSTNDDERTLTGLVVRESDRLSRLLAEFLDFARARVTRISALDLNAIASGAVNLAGQHPDRAEGVEVGCSTPADPIMIEGDEDLLHRALFNLTLNAVQAVPAHGRVRVEVSVVPRAQLPNGMTFENGAVAVHVIDDGPGIPADVRDRLFDPFFTTKQGGSGLGLAIVHRAVEAHRGFVLVDSPVAGDGAEGGTRFTVLLPRAQIASDSLSALSARDGGAPHQFAPTYEDSSVPGVIGAIS